MRITTDRLAAMAAPQPNDDAPDGALAGAYLPPDPAVSEDPAVVVRLSQTAIDLSDDVEASADDPVEGSPEGIDTSAGGDASPGSAEAPAGPSSFVADGGEVIVDVRASASGYDNQIFWSSDNWKTKNFIAIDNDVTSVSLGTFAAGTKIEFGIDNGQGDFFKTGAASLNPDGIQHANVDRNASGTTIGFEDLLGGGDRDFDDAILHVRTVRRETDPDAESVSRAEVPVAPPFDEARVHSPTRVLRSDPGGEPRHLAQAVVLLALADPSRAVERVSVRPANTGPAIRGVSRDHLARLYTALVPAAAQRKVEGPSRALRREAAEKLIDEARPAEVGRSHRRLPEDEVVSARDASRHARRDSSSP